MADGFKNSTRTQYITGGYGDTKGAAQVSKVMSNFKRGQMPVESTSARPAKVGPTPEEIRQKAAVERGNRMQAMEAAEEAKLMRRPVTPIKGGGTQNKALGRGAAMDGPVMKPVNRAMGGPALPSQASARAGEAIAARKAAPTLPSQANTRATEVVAARPVARKTGGLAVMPRGKKKC